MTCRLDESLIYQRAQMPPHRFLTQTNRLANGVAAQPGLAVFQTPVMHQVDVHQQRSLLQAELEDFMGQRE